MALKAIVKSLDDVPEALRGLYKADGDRFVLDLNEDEIKEHPVTRPLSNAYNAEKERRQKDAEKMAALQATIDKFKDIDPEKAREAMAKLEEIETKGLKDDGKFEELIDREKAKIKANYDTTIEKLQKDLAAASEFGAKMRSTLKQEKISNAVRDAAAEHVKPALMPYFIADALKIFDLDDDDKIVAMDGDIHRRDSKGDLLTIDSWRDEHLTKNVEFALPNRGAGATGGGNGRGAGGERVVDMNQRNAIGNNLEAFAKGEARAAFR